MSFNLDDYEPVASRIGKFYKAHPDGRIITDLVHYLADVAVFKAEIWIGDLLVSTGWEEEVRNSSHINKSSHLANAETGAVGRGLANYNLAGSDPTKRPSREEMSKGQRSAPAPYQVASMASANGVTVKGKQHGPLPDWLALAAFQAGVTEVYDNRDSLQDYPTRPWFKATTGGKDAKAFWAPKGTPLPVVAMHEDDLLEDLSPEEPF